MMFSQRSIISCVTACCCLIHIKSTHSFVVPVVTLQTSSTSYQSPSPTTTTKLLMAASTTTSTMPDVVGISGCDAELWNNIPYGAQRDLERFCRMAADEDYEFIPTKEFPISPLELAQNRVATMQDINRFVVKKANKKNENEDEDEEDSVSITPFEDLAWNNGVSSWELNNLAQKEMAIAKVKAEKKAANKLLREEAAAKAEAEAAEKAKEAEAEAKKTDTTMENDDNAFQ